MEQMECYLELTCGIWGLYYCLLLSDVSCLLCFIFSYRSLSSLILYVGTDEIVSCKLLNTACTAINCSM